MSCHEEYLQNKQETATRVIACIVWSMDPICWAMKLHHWHATLSSPGIVAGSLTNKTFVDVAVGGFDWLCWSFEAEPTMRLFARVTGQTLSDPSPGLAGITSHDSWCTGQSQNWINNSFISIFQRDDVIAEAVTLSWLMTPEGFPAFLSGMRLDDLLLSLNKWSADIPRCLTPRVSEVTLFRFSPEPF